MIFQDPLRYPANQPGREGQQTVASVKMVGECFETASLAKQVSLKIVGYLEPNNGRELWDAELSIAGTDHNRLFRHGCSALNFQLNGYQFCSYDESLVFIPAETDAFIIQTEKLGSLPLEPGSKAVSYLPKVSLSTLKFLGNCFHQHYVVVVYRDCLQILNTKTAQLKTEQFGDFSIFQFCCQQGVLTISLRNQSGSQCQERTFQLEPSDQG